MSFEIQPLKLSYLNALCPPKTAEERVVNQVRAILGVGCVGLSEGFIIGAAGIVPIIGKSAYAWASLTEDVTERHKFSLHKAVKRIFPVLAKIKGIETIYAVADPIHGDFKCNCSWLEHLGFQQNEKGLYQWRISA